jgi:methylated-DNA-[protein]-cysteine S-methyltransferase
MRCCDVEALWDELREGIQPRREHVLAHLRTCSHCQELYKSYEGVAYCLSCLPIVEPPQSLVPTILEHIATMRTPADDVATVESPLGTLLVAFNARSITALTLVIDGELEDAKVQVARRLRRPLRDAQAPPWLIETLDEFFTTWTPDMKRVDITWLSKFEQAALSKAAQIPRGEVRSYGWIAREIGHPHAARAVGQAMARNPVPFLVPCHRVVDASGSLHDYGYGIEMKARILAMEGYRKESDSNVRTTRV